MQNIDVRFNATSNFGKVHSDLAKVQAQAQALGQVFQQRAFAQPGAVVDPDSWKAGSRAIHEASNAYRNAVSSSGLLTSQQIRATAESENFTKSLQKQKLTMGEMARSRGVMKQVYADQLRYQRMTAQYWGTDSAGRAITDITIPKNVPRDLDTVAQKMHFTGTMARSAGTQIVNMGKNMQWAGRQLMVGFTYPVALVGAAAGVMAYKVDEAMTKVTKVYDVSAAAMENESLRVKELNEVRIRSWEVAEKSAKKYGQSAEQTLGVESALAATGLSGDKLFSSVDAVSRIATLGDLDLTASTDMTIALQTAFRKTIKDADDLTEAFDFMNAVENATSLEIKHIADMIPRAASAMSALGVTVQESTVLMTAMKEAGVDAAEGANALKSATGTILAPSPAADKFIQQISNGQVQVTKLAEESGGNLYQALQLLYNQMEGLSDLQKQQILVKLFGKYQFNRVSAMVTNLGDAFTGTQNQTAKAIELMGEDTKKLGDLADQELAQKMEAISGRFKAAWQSMRIELAKAGEPFLELATVAAQVAGNVLGMFNDMSSWKKKAVLLVGAIMAIVGPVVMLGGLFMNLGGQFVTGLGRVMTVLGKFGGAVGLVNKEQMAAKLSADAQNAAALKATKTTSTLAQEMQVLSTAYARATAEAQKYMAAENARRPVGPVQGPATQSIAGAGIQGRYQLSSREQSYFNQTAARTQGGGFRSNSSRLDEARNSLARDYMKSMNVVERDAKGTAKWAAQEQRTRAKTAAALNGASISMGVMAVSSALMMAPVSQGTKDFAQFAMIASMVVPALSMAATWLGTMVRNGVAFTATQWSAVRAAQAGTGAIGAMSAATSMATGAAIGFGRALNAALGPVGWVVLGITAVSGALMAVNRHQEKIKQKNAEILKKQLDANRELQSSSDSIATSMGKAAGSYSQFSNPVVGKVGQRRRDQSLERYTYYKEDEVGKKQISALQDGDGNLLEMDKLVEKVRTKYIDLQVIGKNTAKQTRTEMQAMLQAAGMGTVQAQQMASDMYTTYGKVANLNWTRPINDQLDAMAQLGRSALKIEKSVAAGRTMYTYSVDEGAMEQWKVQGEKAAQILGEALARATSPETARKYIDQYMEGALAQWDVGYDKLISSTLSGNEEIKELFKKYGIENGETFAKNFNENASFQEDFNALGSNINMSGDLRNELSTWTKMASAYEKAFIVPVSDYLMDLDDNIGTVVGALGGFNDAFVGLGIDDATKQLTSQNAAYLEYTGLVAKAEELTRRGFGPDSKEMLDLKNQLAGVDEELLPVINSLLALYNLKPGRDTAEALVNLFGKVTKAKKGVDDLGNSIDGLPDRKNVKITVNQAADIGQEAMAAVQQRMADSAMDKFNDGWDATMDNMSASHDAAADAMDKRQEAAQEAFDARWEARKEAVNKEYEQRIDRVNKEIKAQQKADEVRQRLFENEKARLAALAERDNTNIDFNTQLNEGKLDEAAKTANNAGVKSANDQMDAEQRAAELTSEARIEALEKKNNRLEKARDKEIKNLEKLEARMRKHLERVQEARRNALEKQQADVMKSLDKQRQYEEATLQQRLDLFLAYTAKNKKDLERWMNELGLNYDTFGNNVEKKGASWAKSMRTSLLDEIRLAGTKVMNDNMWENIGKSMGGKMVKGMGFNDMKHFRKFVRTGNMDAPKGKGGMGDIEGRHEGGVIGTGGGSRKGVPQNYKGLHRSEKMVLAQKGEYVVNKKAVKGNLGMLEAINKGADTTIPGMGGIGTIDGRLSADSNGFGGPAALMAGAVSQMYAAGIKKAFANAYDRGAAKQAAAAAGSNYAGNAGTYGGRTFGAEQMKNAATIASVGASMGMSTRDIQIGIMTAIAESGLVNVNYGDRDSLGLFQQRPSMGWGTPAQVTDPVYASRAFFGPLKAHTERNEETPWLAAQHIQRSAFADGSNYRVWWEAAQGIFKKGLKPSDAPGGGYIPGKGGKHKPINHPVSNGLHGGSTAGNPPAVDMAAPTGSPIYAVASGRITSSRDISGPLSTDSYRGDGPYGSFGRVIQMQTDDGHGILYAHLSRRSVSTGQRVQGGSTIGYSGNTGNSSGPHLHFGATNSPYAWLRKGGEIKYDNTHVVAHKGETMLSAPVTRQLKDNIASGGGSGYNVTIDLRGSYIKEDVDIERAVNTAIDKRESKVGRRRVVR